MHRIAHRGKRRGNGHTGAAELNYTHKLARQINKSSVLLRPGQSSHLFVSAPKCSGDDFICCVQPSPNTNNNCGQRTKGIAVCCKPDVFTRCQGFCCGRMWSPVAELLQLSRAPVASSPDEAYSACRGDTLKPKAIAKRVLVGLAPVHASTSSPRQAKRDWPHRDG